MKTINNISHVKYNVILLLILFPITTLFAQNNKSVSGVEVVKTNTQEVLGINVGFYVEFKNNNDIAVDALKYKVFYYDGFDEKMGEKSFKWQSGNIIKSIESGKTIKDYHANWIKGANKIKVSITRVHFVDKKSNSTGD
jgi:hypothetical protein